MHNSYRGTYEGTKFISCPKDAENITIREGTTEIAVQAFKGCEALTEIVIPEGVTKIDSYAFEGCINLAKLTLPKSLTDLKWDTFNEMVGTEYKHNYLHYKPVPELISENEKADAIYTLMKAANGYRPRSGAGGTVCRLINADSNYWGDGAGIRYDNYDGKNQFRLSMIHDYISKYSEYESGMDTYDTITRTMYIDIPDGLSESEAVLYAVEHVSDWVLKDK